MDSMLLDAFYIVVIAAAGLIGGFAPAKLSGATGLGGLALGNAFAGGVFLGAGLLHLLPDSRENFSQALPAIDFPLALLGAGIGVVLILGFDQFSRARKQAENEGQKGRALILFLVLSIHSVIAGAALGIESAAGAGLAIFIAIIAHKSAAGFALGIALENEAGDATRRRLIITAFSLMTPIGIVLGIGLEAMFTGPDHFIWEACFDALAAGTFLYVAMSEILPQTFERRHSSAVKFVLVAAGVSLMALIAIWA